MGARFCCGGVGIGPMKNAAAPDDLCLNSRDGASDADLLEGGCWLTVDGVEDGTYLFEICVSEDEADGAETVETEVGTALVEALVVPATAAAAVAAADAVDVDISVIKDAVETAELEDASWSVVGTPVSVDFCVFARDFSGAGRMPDVADIILANSCDVRGIIDGEVLAAWLTLRADAAAGVSEAEDDEATAAANGVAGEAASKVLRQVFVRI